jgi:Fe2+ or Zn2+ uptake regulation protein
MIQKMVKVSEKQQKIIGILLKNRQLSSSEIHNAIFAGGQEVSLVTIRRLLSDLANRGLLLVSGSGRSTVYSLATSGRLVADIDPKQYVAIEPDKRYGLSFFRD